MKNLWKERKKILFLACAVFMVLFVGILISFNRGIERTDLRPTGGTKFARAVVEEVLESNNDISENGEYSGNQKVRIRITSGEFEGEVCEAQSPYANHSGADCYPGLKVIILVNQNDAGEIVASVYNYDRTGMLWMLIVLFLAILCVIGGKKGFAAAAGLVFTFACIFFFYIPLMYTGFSPFLAATLTAVLITIVVMMMIGGWSYKTLCSILGTIAGVLIAGGMAALFGKLSHISGLNVDDIETLAYVAENSDLKVSGVLFSGILIASLGAVMDVSMSVSSTIAEIHEANPEFSVKRLFQSGINVGKDMMGTMSNTLILAFAGSSVSTLLITYAYNKPYLEYMNDYAIGIELLRGMSGSIGVIMTVPFVSAISAFLMAGAHNKHFTKN
ncbi:MAG: YibE/F family protein [Lachnospiraceae bacterium]|nr:YibE/F family protein [Lachnospiraceae bacterium]